MLTEFRLASLNMILFLDFDGVLHPRICYNQELLLCRRNLFEDLLRDRAHVDVVISSTWRDNRTLSQLKSLFSGDVAERLVGLTPHWRNIQDDASFGTYVRQAEIEAWLRQADRAYEKWIALDDQPHLFRPFMKNLVLTDPESGLTEEVCDILRRKLGEI